ncbi:hypothetical protein Csa_015781 [Cucumis sativus]|uniref:Uncharacterized protein n=1 Tax=Cucumis sativus TaxID=3659 RepID=A0A0A0K3X5_CUCSA|nr:hypothetical protein Csa_015781 [Cucumis sativus]
MGQPVVSYVRFKTQIASQIFKRTTSINYRFKPFRESTTSVSILQAYDEHQKKFKRTTSILQVYDETLQTYGETIVFLRFVQHASNHLKLSSNP